MGAWGSKYSQYEVAILGGVIVLALQPAATRVFWLFRGARFADGDLIVHNVLVLGAALAAILASAVRMYLISPRASGSVGVAR